MSEPEVVYDQPAPETAARQASATGQPLKEDAVTVTPVPHVDKEDMTVGGRYEAATADRIARRDAGMRYDLGVCPTCGHQETFPAGAPPRTTYMACPVCGDTIRFTGIGVPDPKAEPLPSIADDEMRSS